MNKKTLDVSAVKYASKNGEMFGVALVKGHDALALRKEGVKMEKVIARIVTHHDFPGDQVILFFPERRTRDYNIDSYMLAGGHGEASLDFYHDCTRALGADEEKDKADKFISWYERSINEGEVLARRTRLSMNDLRTKAWR